MVLIKGSSQVSSIFDLIGTQETDMTKALGWTLSRCPQLLRLLVMRATGQTTDVLKSTIWLEKYDSGYGRTDVEIELSDGRCIILELKKGWMMPGQKQLETYMQRSDLSRRQPVLLVAITDCSEEYATREIDKLNIDRLRISHLRWAMVWRLTFDARVVSGNKEKAILSEFAEYLERIMLKRRVDSNYVFVVSLSGKKPEGWGISWIEVVARHRKYFHPYGAPRWPKEPPTYIGFRYHGQLQSIHFIEDFAVTRDLGKFVPGIPAGDWDEHFLYDLGVPIVPAHEVKAGPRVRQSARVWCMLDLLLTSETISDALTGTKEREQRFLQ